MSEQNTEQSHDGEQEASFYEQLFDSISEGVVFTDRNHLILRANREFMRMFCFEEEEVIGRSPDELIVPPGLVSEAETISDLTGEGECISMEAVRCRKDGTPIHVSLLASPIKSGQDVVGHYVIYRDISLQMYTRKELYKEKSYLDQLFDGAGEAIALVDKGGYLVRMNTEFTRIFGYTFGDLEGSVLHSTIIPHERSHEEEEIDRDLAYGKTVRLDTVRQCKNGESISVSLTAIPVVTEGKYSGAFLIYRDNSRQRKTLATLQEKTRFLSTLMKNLPGMVYRSRNDDHRSMEFMSEEAGSFTGYSSSELVGEGSLSFHDLIHEEDRDMVVETVRKAVSQNRPFHLVYRILTADGEEKWLLDHGRGVRASDGSVLFLEGFITDITSTKRSEEALSNSRKRIAKLHEIAGILQSCMTEERIFDLTIGAAKRLLDFDACTLTIKENDISVLKGAITPDGMENTRGCSINEGIEEMTFSNRGTILFETDRKRLGTPAKQDLMQSGVSIAIGEFGVFQATSSRKHAFPDSDLRLLELLLGYTTLAIRRLRLQADLRNQATHDPLTGVFNRNYFDHIIEIEAQRAERYGRPVGFLMIDIDHFKDVNDTLGHQAGDKVLICVASIIRDILRKTDIIIRYGGDEFLIILTETGNGSLKVVPRLKTGTSTNQELTSIAGHPVTISIGSAFWEPGSGRTIDDVLRIADTMMYADKKSGAPQG